MKKLQTPMNRMKDHFHRFKGELFPICRKCLELSYREQAYSNYAGAYGNGAYIKPIKSDFIRIYNLTDLSSVAFKFTFLAPDKKTIIETQYMEVLLKIDEVYYNSRIYNMDESKALMREINKHISDFNSDELNPSNVIYYLKALCIHSADETDKHVKVFAQSYGIESAELLMRLDTEQTYQTTLTNSIKSATDILRTYENQMPEKEKLIAARVEVRRLERVINESVVAKHRELKVNENHNLLEDSQRTAVELKDSIYELGFKVNESFKLPLEHVVVIYNKIIK